MNDSIKHNIPERVIKHYAKSLVHGLNQDKIPNRSRVAASLIRNFLAHFLKHGDRNAYIYKSHMQDVKGDLSFVVPYLANKGYLNRGSDKRYFIGPKLLSRLEKAREALLNECKGNLPAILGTTEILPEDNKKELERLREEMSALTARMGRLENVVGIVAKKMVEKGDFADEGLQPPSDRDKIRVGVKLLEENPNILEAEFERL